MVRKLTELYSEYARYGLVDIEDLQRIAEQFRYGPQEPAGQGPLIEPEGTLVKDEEGNKFRVVGGKYVGE